jgi:signal transduction histidine kinase/ActR/RegA family two-component response regulator
MKRSEVSSGRRTTARALLGDRVLQVALAAYGLSFCVLVLSRSGSEDATEGYRALVDPLLLAVTVLALTWGRARLAPLERRFWDLLGLAWLCWLLVEFFFFFEISPPFVSATFAIDALHILYYLLFALAVNLSPHVDRGLTLRAAGRRLESVAGLAAVFGLLTYFALVVLPEPFGLSLSFVPRSRGLTPFLLVRLSLDLLLVGRLVYSAFDARERWARLYSLLAAGMLCFAARDALALLQYEGKIAADAQGLGYEALLYVPGFVILLAARSRHLPTSEDGHVEAGEHSRSAEKLDRASPIALYALVVPLMHFLFYPLGFLEPASRPAREVFSLVYLLILGAMAWVHQILLAKDNRIARTALRRAEERLVRSQRLESVGRLAGGIAHDFNNYLTVIQGYSELLRERLLGSEEQEDLECIEDAARKATNLTGQLLAIGRRQMLRPEPLDLNTVIRETSEMLGSLLGEDVVLEVDLDSETGLANADRGQTEQVLINLAINGRDAMPRGGALTIRSRRLELGSSEAGRLEVKPGSYVSLVVSDSGVGMSVEVQARAFEPFFTTKEMDRGTGLGLSTVYGIVTQSGGAVTVDSAPGKGTVVTVLLPAAPPRLVVEPAAADPSARRRRANVLLVEDEDAVRRLGTEALSHAGFDVLSASGGPEAVARYLDSCDSLDLLVTDIMMPEMDGIELATAFQARCPGLPALFVSGYSAETLRERQVVLPESMRLLEKPFSPSALVEMVRELIDANPARGPRPVPVEKGLA